MQLIGINIINNLWYDHPIKLTYEKFTLWYNGGMRTVMFLLYNKACDYSRVNKSQVKILFLGCPNQKLLTFFTNYIFFKYSSNSGNFIFLAKLEIYTSLE